MVATEPLSPRHVGGARLVGRETISDQHHLFFYAQRTIDDRIAIGGRGAPYKLGSPINEAYERRDEVRARLISSIQQHFGPAGRAAITHHWGGPLGVPRDWCMSVVHDRAAGLRGPAATPATASWRRTSRVARSPISSSSAPAT